MRSCFAELELSKVLQETIDRGSGQSLLAAGAYRQLAGLDLLVPVHERVRNLLDLGIADPLADGLVALVDVDAVAGAAQRLGDTGSCLAMRLPHGHDAHLHGREPERERAAVVLDEDADEALERAEERPVDHV